MLRPVVARHDDLDEQKVDVDDSPKWWSGREKTFGVGLDVVRMRPGGDDDERRGSRSSDAQKRRRRSSKEKVRDLEGGRLVTSAGRGLKAVLARQSLVQVVGRVPARYRQVTIERATLVQQFSLRSVMIWSISSVSVQVYPVKFRCM